jgi:hypothetical protein
MFVCLFDCLSMFGACSDSTQEVWLDALIEVYGSKILRTHVLASRDGNDLLLAWGDHVSDLISDILLDLRWVFVFCSADD